MLLEDVDFPPPLEEISRLRADPEWVDRIRCLADAADHALVGDPDHADADTMAQVAMTSRLGLVHAFGTAEAGLLGLTLAVQSHLCHARGQLDEALGHAEGGIKFLAEPTARDPERLQPVLLLCHGAGMLAELGLGRRLAALSRLDRMTVMLQRMAERDERYETDLADHEAMRAAILAASDRPGAARGTGGESEAGAASGSRGDAAQARADARYDDGVAAGQEGRMADADAAMRDAAKLYDKAGGPQGELGTARCRWRRSMYLLALGRPTEAVRLGQEAVAQLRKLIGTDADVEVSGQYVRTCADVSVMLTQHQRHREACGLADEAVRVARSRQGLADDADTELGTALHNVAAAHFGQAMATARAGRDPVPDLAQASRAADEAVALRERLAQTGPPLSRWELANSLLHRAQLRPLVGQLDGALADLRKGERLAQSVGAQDLVVRAAQLRAILQAAQR
jgi:hypothetical protein